MSTEPTLDEQIAWMSALIETYTPNARQAHSILNRLRALPREGAAGEFGRTDLPQVTVYTAQLAESRLDRPNMLSGYHQMVMFADHQRALDKAIAALSPQAYTPAALSTDTAADTSRERGEARPESHYERTAYCLMEMMKAYERRIRSDCKTQEDLDKRPWECSEYLAAADILKRTWTQLRAPAAAPVEMERDARRYRFIRNCLHLDCNLLVTSRKHAPPDLGVISCAELDAQIDAAIAAAGEGA